MHILPASDQSPSFFSMSPDQVHLDHYVIAWTVSDKGDSPEPVLYPAVPKNSALFYENGMSTVINAKTGARFGSREGAYASLVKK